MGITAREAAHTILFAAFDGAVRNSTSTNGNGNGKYVSELRVREQYSVVKDEGLQEVIWADTEDMLARWLP